MIFYIATDEDGFRHIKPTQALAVGINKDFVQIDIPTDKAGLMEAVQELLTKIDVLEKSGALSDAPEPEVEASVEPVEETAPVPAEAPVASESETVAVSSGRVFSAKDLDLQIELLGELGETGFELMTKHHEMLGIGAYFSQGVHILSVLCTGEHQLTRLFFRAKKTKFG